VTADADSPPHPGRLYALAILTQFIWALNNNISKFALKAFPPLLLAGVRSALAAFLMGLVYSATRPHRWDWSDAPKLLAMGAVGVGLNQLFFVVGISRTSVTHAALILPLTPLLTLLMASVLGQERITLGKLSGMAIAFCGVLVLQLSKGSAAGATLAGDFLIFLGVLSFAFYIVMGKRASARHNGLVVSMFAYAGTALAFLPLTLWQSQGFDFAQVPVSGWLSLFYMAAFSSVIGYLLHYYVLTHMAASRVSAFSYAQPVMSTSLAAILLGEPVTAVLLLSGALVLAGVWVTERAR
jgi:drug/metabolite transporter (DMT)-like permease